MYWAEKALTRAIPKMVKKAESKTLVKALQTHLKETEKQVTRLEKVFQQIGKKATAKKCVAMDGLIKEAEEIMGEAEAGPMRDAAIIMAAQKVEHYEIASYGTMRQFAETLGMDTAADLLEMTLDEEKNADETLTDIATASINSEAAGSSEKSTQKSASKGPEKKGSTKNDKKKPTDEEEDEDDIDADEDDGDDEEMDDDDDTNQKKSMRTAGSDDDDDYDDADDVDEYEDVDNYDDGGDTEEEYQ
jgi:ferritin-like metal-binding protein YciE